MQKTLLLALIFVCTSCSQILYQPDQYLYIRPSEHGFNVVEEVVVASDGTKLGSWFLKHNKNKEPSRDTLVVFFHGNAQNISAHFSVVSWMSDYGLDVFMGDYRGYGISEGSPNPAGVEKDALAFLDHSYKVFKKNKYKKLIILAQSLGGAIAMNALQLFAHRDEINLLVLDSTFINPKNVAHDKIWGLGYLLISGAHTAENLNHLTMPTLVVHGAEDKVIPYKFGLEIYQQILHEKKWWWLRDHGTHIATFQENNKTYRQKLIEVIESI